MKYVYKIIAAIFSLATIPIALFSKIFYFEAESTALKLLGTLGSQVNSPTINEALAQYGGKIPEYMGDSYSIYDLLLFAKEFPGIGEASENGTPLTTAVITFAVILIIALIFAVVTAVFAIAAKNNRKVIYTSIGGLTFSIMLTYAFESISAPILSGEISLASITGIDLISIIADIKELSLDTPFWFLPLTFIAVIVWTVIYNVTLPEKEKKERKLMLGEADD